MGFGSADENQLKMRTANGGRGDASMGVRAGLSTTVFRSGDTMDALRSGAFATELAAGRFHEKPAAVITTFDPSMAVAQTTAGSFARWMKR